MIKNRLTLKQLEAFVCVARFKTFRKAAAALGTTQPNISVRIAALEETLGVGLMRRDAGSIDLTPRGEELLKEARKVLRATETLLDVAERRDLIEDKLRLGVTEMVAATWLHDFLRQIKAHYPSLRIELTVDLSRELQAMLKSAELDLAILTGPVGVPDFTALPTDTNDYCWVASPSVAIELGPEPTFEQIFNLGILTHGKRTTASKELSDHLAQLGLPSEGIAHCNSLTALLRMAVDGLGVAVLPKGLAERDLAVSDLTEIQCDWVPDPLEFFTCYSDKSCAGFVEEVGRIALGADKSGKE